MLFFVNNVCQSKSSPGFLALGSGKGAADTGATSRRLQSAVLAVLAWQNACRQACSRRLTGIQPLSCRISSSPFTQPFTQSHPPSPQLAAVTRQHCQATLPRKESLEAIGVSEHFVPTMIAEFRITPPPYCCHALWYQVP